MSTIAALESRDTPSQFQLPPSSLSGPVRAATSTQTRSLDGPACPGPPTVISGATSRTTDPTSAATPSRGAMLRRSTRDSTQLGQESVRSSSSNDERDLSTPQPDELAHSVLLNGASGGPSTIRITDRNDPVITTSDSLSTSRRTAFSRDPAQAATPPRSTLLRRSTRETQMGEGHTKDDLASRSNDELCVSTPRLDNLGRSDPLTTTFGGASTSSDPASPPVVTSGLGAALQRSPGDPTLMDMGDRLDDQANAWRELSHNVMVLSQNVVVLSHRIAALETKIADGERSERPEVKITPWRALNTVFLLVVGAYKAATTYLGQTTGPSTADWIIGVVWALLTYWVTFYEELEVDEKLGHPSWFFTYDLSGVLYQNLEYLLHPFFIFALMVVFFITVHKIGPENVSWAFIFSSVLVGMVASWGYFVAFDLLRELMGKLLRQGRLVQFLLDLFHGSDWSLSRSMRFDFTVIVGSLVQNLLSAFEPVRKLWWPFPFTEYAHSNHVVTNIVMSASGTGITITSLILWYIVCGFVRMAYRLVTRGRSSS